MRHHLPKKSRAHLLWWALLGPQSHPLPPRHCPQALSEWENSTRWHSGEEAGCQCRRCGRWRFDPWVGKVPWKRKWQHILVLSGRTLLDGCFLWIFCAKEEDWYLCIFIYILDSSSTIKSQTWNYWVRRCDGPRDMWVSEEALTSEGPFLGHGLESDKFSLFECEISVAAPWTGPLSLHWNAFSLLGFLHWNEYK